MADPTGKLWAKPITISADGIKAAVAVYYRYRCQHPIIAFEAPGAGGTADVLVVTKSRRLIEVEVKVSLSDLRRDVKKSKHWWLQRGREAVGYGYYMPVDQFYFAVPSHLGMSAAVICDRLYPYAGVWGFTSVDDENPRLHREATLFKAPKMSLRQMLQMTRSQSATLCRLAVWKAEKKAEKEAR